MKLRYVFAIGAAVLALTPSLSFAHSNFIYLGGLVAPGDAPEGLPAASALSVAGNVVELPEHIPVHVATNLGYQGYMEMDSHGAYWIGRDVDQHGNLTYAMSAPQGTYTELDNGRSVVVR